MYGRPELLPIDFFGLVEFCFVPVQVLAVNFLDRVSVEIGSISGASSIIYDDDSAIGAALQWNKGKYNGISPVFCLKGTRTGNLKGSFRRLPQLAKASNRIAVKRRKIARRFFPEKFIDEIRLIGIEYRHEQKQLGRCAGRKPTGSNTEMITLTLTKAQAALLKKYAEDAGMTVSRLVVKMFCLPVSDKKPKNPTCSR